MEWVKNMGLKKSFFLLSVFSMMAALLVIGMVFLISNKITEDYPTGGIVYMPDGIVRELEQPTREQMLVLEATGWIEVLSCVLVPVGCVGIASLLFYRYKLKKPIAVLQMGTERIREHDLDFEIPEVSGDELGQVCAAFETMRAELLQTNQELWRQAEERKRLNAAFSHDLRNPVTVLKGTVKQLRQGTADEHALERLEIYVLRLERYVEAMSSIQRLEQMPVQKKKMELCILRDELEETARLLAPDVETQVCVEDRAAVQVCVEDMVTHGGDGRLLCDADAEETSGGKNEQIYKAGISKEGILGAGISKTGISREGSAGLVLDHGLFLTVAENLIGNAARYAQSRIDIQLSIRTDTQYFDGEMDERRNVADEQEVFKTGMKNQQFFVITVTDDGCGYPAKLIKDGPRPFGRMEEDSLHFGMGLYTSQMLCVKHGGRLVLENDNGINGGAKATAVFETGF
ncbi:MAG: HAMP domain-containing histidine kinase [Lachnospiraceae bacterium]|nr:HAMP domain-containing histidine kinase [Lachnospiraceae bacterium]